MSKEKCTPLNSQFLASRFDVSRCVHLFPMMVKKNECAAWTETQCMNLTYDSKENSTIVTHISLFHSCSVMLDAISVDVHSQRIARLLP